MDQQNAIYWYLKCKLSTKKMQFVGTKCANHRPKKKNASNRQKKKSNHRRKV